LHIYKQFGFKGSLNKKLALIAVYNELPKQAFAAATSGLPYDKIIRQN
tara:strand:- start:1917 stop:2060 length:144 start_codon:yes stop_codon:yes gene_type:complete